MTALAAAEIEPAEDRLAHVAIAMARSRWWTTVQPSIPGEPRGMVRMSTASGIRTCTVDACAREVSWR